LTTSGETSPVGGPIVGSTAVRAWTSVLRRGQSVAWIRAPKENEVLGTTPRLRFVGRGGSLRVRQRGDWTAGTADLLRESCRASTAIDKTVAQAIVRARASGTSWSEIGRVLGASDQAETKRALIDAIADNRRAALEHLLRTTT
jgi:hypothetical protein